MGAGENKTSKKEERSRIKKIDDAQQFLRKTKERWKRYWSLFKVGKEKSYLGKNRANLKSKTWTRRVAPRKLNQKS